MRVGADAELIAAILAAPVQVAILGRTRVPPRWALADRVVPEHYLTCWLEGEAELRAGRVRAVMRPGSCAWIPPDMPHSIRPLDPVARFRFYHLRFRVHAPRQEVRPRHDVIVTALGHSLRPHFDTLYDEHRSCLPMRDARFACALGALLIDLLRIAEAGDRRADDTLDARSRQRILAWVADRPTVQLHPRDLARTLGMSLDTCTRRFRRTFGVAPRTWLLRERIRALAMVLGESAASLEAVARAHGFSSPALMSRQFRRVMGVAPGRYRARFHA